jgi:arsenate reductase (glutaredoxin)
MIKMYGIPNCDSVKKAKKYLSDKSIDFTFHNYKKQGVPEHELQQWIKQVGWEALLNKRGTTYRSLPNTVKDSIDATSVIQLMLDNPSCIKRPILSLNGHITVGFKNTLYAELF